LFHYALKPEGFLLLGASETIGGFADLFSLMDKKAKFYSKKSTRTKPLVTFSQVAPPVPQLDPGVGAVNATTELGPSLADIQKQGDRIVLTHHTPAGVIV